MRIVLPLFLLAVAVLVTGVVTAPTMVDAQELEPDMRDLYIKSGNPDGSFLCARWCGLTEPCC